MSEPLDHIVVLAMPDPLPANTVIFLANPATKTFKHFFTSKTGELYKQEPIKNYKVYNTVTDSNGNWSQNLANDFISVDSGFAVVIFDTNDVSEMKLPTHSEISNNTIRGNALESRRIVTLILGGGEGMENSEAGRHVQITVFGILK